MLVRDAPSTRQGASIEPEFPPPDSDVLGVLVMFDFSKNRGRKNVMRSKDEDRGFVLSDTVGLVPRRGEPPSVSEKTASSLDVCRLLNLWSLSTHGFERASCTSITVNKAFASARQRDSHNEGPSVARALSRSQEERMSALKAFTQSPCSLLIRTSILGRGQIFIRMLSGKKITLQVEANDTVDLTQLEHRGDDRISL